LWTPEKACGHVCRRIAHSLKIKRDAPSDSAGEQAVSHATADENNEMEKELMIDFNVVLFDDFETLDAFGPAEIIGKMPNTYRLEYYSLQGGIVTSSQRIRVDTLPFSAMDAEGVLLIPGGMGTRPLIDDADFIRELNTLAHRATFVLTVCTGSALLAKTGLLNGRSATSNKMAYAWVESVNPDVNWVKQARWAVDGKFYTSSGVSAGMDMTLGFISDMYGQNIAGRIASGIEYIWNADKNFDPFAS
jgi:transcriptional regulator GlxA family with amidase domain